MRSANRAAALCALLLAWSAGALADEPRHRDGRNARAPDRVAPEPRRGDHRVRVPPPPVHRHAAPPAPAWRGDLPRFRAHDARPWRDDDVSERTPSTCTSASSSTRPRRSRSWPPGAPG